MITRITAVKNMTFTRTSEELDWGLGGKAVGAYKDLFQQIPKKLARLPVGC